MGCVPLALRLMVALSERARLPLLRRPNRLSRCAAAVRVSGLLPAGLTRPPSADPCIASSTSDSCHLCLLIWKAASLLCQIPAIHSLGVLSVDEGLWQALLQRSLHGCIARHLTKEHTTIGKRHMEGSAGGTQMGL